MSQAQQGKEVASVAAIVSGITKDLPFLADLQWREMRSSMGLNRKLYGILPSGIFNGFFLKPAAGLNLTISSKETEHGVGTASQSLFNIGTDGNQGSGYQITIHQINDVNVVLVAGKLNIIVIRAYYDPENNVVTEQVNPESKVKAVQVHVVHDINDDNFKNGIELGRVQLAAGATSIKESDINNVNRKMLSVGTFLAEVTGQSRIYGMTQKAISDELKRIEALAKSGGDGAAEALQAAKTAQTTANNAQTAANNANTNANGRVPNTRKVNGKPLSTDINLGASDVGTYTKAEIDTKDTANKTLADNAQKTANEAKTAAATAQTAANNANTNANGRVPSTRKVNGKELSTDITLNSNDVGTYTKAEIDTKDTANKTLADNAQRTANEAKTAASTAQTTANNANTNANGRVPSTRKINGKELSADIDLWAKDVDAINVNIVGTISNNQKMSDANKTGWWQISVSNTSTVADFPKDTNGVNLYGYGYMFVYITGSNGFQHYYGHRGANVKRQWWNTATENSAWVVDYNSANKPSTADLNTYTKAEIDTKDAANKTLADNAQKTANEGKTAASTAQTTANNANTNANGRVPSGRKVNNKPLTSDITLSASDVGAYTKQEVDSKIATGINGSITNMRRGAAVTPPKQDEYGPKESPAGCVVTSVRHDPTTSYGLFFTYRPLQIYVNGSWKTLAGDA